MYSYLINVIMSRKKIKDLKVGDTIVVYEKYSNRFTPVEGKVTKAGRQYLHVECGYKWNTYKFPKDTGYGDYGRYLFPGTLEEYKEMVEVEQYAKEVIKYIESNKESFTREDLDKVMSILKGSEYEDN